MSEAEDLKREYKLVVVGAGGVGKSCLTFQFVHSQFADEIPPSEDLYKKQCVVDDEAATLSILDHPPEQEDRLGFARPMREEHIHYGEGFMLVYSITSRRCFKELEISEIYQRILRIKGQESFPVILVANKCDLEYERQVNMDEGRDFARRIGRPFFETSAKYRIHVDEAFHQLVREIKNYDKETAGVIGRDVATAKDSSLSSCVVV